MDTIPSLQIKNNPQYDTKIRQQFTSVLEEYQLIKGLYLDPLSSYSILGMLYIYLSCAANESDQEMWCHDYQSQGFLC